ncbi:hypothetical protein [Salisediminibacterium beveridgei]|uniref:Uncharacterized protein n=1 Tax=Salisediminibacterium beveridgei TaxID=632773 RepID=A0A1D7QTQ9_9BACI|nr:hypothetical protein [Salisediminibacterium beveridgei]AOM82401.1 hypothetical protein BBEV_1032 [Salisediminibacterium beveridgei]
MGTLTRGSWGFGFIFIVAILLTACQNTVNEEEASLNLNDEALNEEDLDTLISTNEKLVDQLEEKTIINDNLRDEVAELEEENADLREDLLTYRQQTLETEQYVTRYQEVRLTIDEMTRKVFMAMHDRDHVLLDTVTTDQIEPDGDRNLLVIETDEDMTRSFHYLQIDSFQSMRQMEVDYDRENESVQVVYGLYSVDDESFFRNTTVNLEFIHGDNNEWLLDHIAYQ